MKKAICFIALWIVCACDHSMFSPIPGVPVNLELNLNFADSDLMPALAAKSFTQQRLTTDRLGFGGILVVNGASANGALNLCAYDLACPYEVDKNVKLIPDNEGKAHCPKCGSTYVTMWGTGLPETTSLSKYPLRSYVVKSTGGNTFVVVN